MYFEFVVEFELPPQSHKITARVRAKNIDQAQRRIRNAHPECKILSAYRASNDINMFRSKNKYNTY